MMTDTVVILLLILAVATADVLHLTADNYDFFTANKSVLIMFYAPWCLHSKKVSPEFDKLAADWKGNTGGALVAKVDCSTPEGKKLCTQHRVTGFPTILYGSNPKKLQSYDGGRAYKDLATFAKANLKPFCSPLTLDSCSDESIKKELQELMTQSDEAIERQLQEEKQKLKEATQMFNSRTKELEDKYNVLLEEMKSKVKDIKVSVLDIADTVKKFKERQEANQVRGEEL